MVTFYWHILYIHTCTYSVHTYIHTYIHTYCTYLHIYIHTYILYMHTYIHTYTYSRTYIYLRTHTLSPLVKSPPTCSGILKSSNSLCISETLISLPGAPLTDITPAALKRLVCWLVGIWVSISKRLMTEDRWLRFTYRRGGITGEEDEEKEEEDEEDEERRPFDRFV